jgi:Putative Ig domain
VTECALPALGRFENNRKCGRFVGNVRQSTWPSSRLITVKEAIIRTTQMLATRKVRSLFALMAMVTAAATATTARATTPCGFSENFDGVTAPALPAGWLATNAQGQAPLWVTSNVSPDTVPNDAFVDDPATISDKRLDTPSVAITSGTAQVTFRNYFNTESTFDGGVLEISFGGNNFIDIIAAGGSFVTGGYNASISTAFQSPIAGRQAWSGNSGGYITTIANLGPNAAGQTVTLRFRMASDTSVSSTGWRLDTISVVDGACASPTPTPTPSPPPPVITSPLDELATVGQPFVYQIEAPGATGLDVGGLPPGLNFLPPQNTIVGNPTATGIFQVRLFASNSGGTTSATLFITVQQFPTAGPVIISSSAATGRVGQPFIFRVFTTGGTPTATLTASGLPPGLVINAVPGVTGLISGTPTVEGSSAVTLTVRDGQFTNTSTLQLTFTADPGRPVIISPSSASLTPGQFFTYTIIAPSSASPPDPATFTYTGNLPGGLTFDAATGTISGIYSPLLRESARGSGPRKPELAGGTLLGSIQLFATNGHGTSTIPLAFLRPSPGVVNISTRLRVETGDNVLIGGFIITGNAPEVVIVRAIGPSLTGIPGALQDPVLELHDSANHVVSNDNWRDSQQDLINATTIPPTDNRESAIVIGLDPGNYTAIVAGKNGTTGIALVEVYDLGTASLDISGVAKLANISTRGFVNTGDNAMIGGFVIRGQTTRVIVRAIGPSLSASGIQGALQDTVLELHDGSGSLIFMNDDWRSTQEQEIIATGVPPTDDRESAIVANLVPGAYTAIVRGKNNTTGVALVEVYALQ